MPDIDPNALIILVIMIIGGLKGMIERIKGPQENQFEEYEDQGTPFQDLYEEARREIQQRQGYEEHEQESRPVIFEPLSQPPPAPVPPPLPTAAKPVKRQPEPEPYQLKQVKRQKLTAAEQAALERLQAEGMQSRRRRRRAAGGNTVRSLLSTPGSARSAIVLREILGPPKGAM